MRVKVGNLINICMHLQIFFVLFSGIIYSYNSSTAILSYVPDFINVILVLLMIRNGGPKLKKGYIFLFLFVGYVILSALGGDRNWYYVVAQGRRYVSAIIVFFAASNYISQKYWKKTLDLFLLAQGINTGLTMYQNLIMKLHPDFCNGIFGFTDYYNAQQGIFSLLISVIAMVYFVDKKWSVKKTIYAIGTSCVVCAFSEVKAYFVLLIVGFIMVFLFRCEDKTKRKKVIRFILILAILFLVAYKILEIIFPYNLKTFFNLSQYILYEEYGNRGGAGRTSTLTYIYDTVFHHNFWMTLFGKGLGGEAVEYAYTIGKLFVSFGLTGIILLLIFFAKLLIECVKMQRNNSENLIAVVMIAMLIITLFVWNAIFTQNCFWLFWVLGSQARELHLPLIEKRIINK